jgi:hypothetical protein
MKKVDLNFEVEGGQGQNGTPFKFKANKGLAELLETEQGMKDEVKIIKYFGWARQLKANGILELDEGDMMELKDFVKNHPTAFLFFKYPVIKAFNDAKSKGKDK